MMSQASVDLSNIDRAIALSQNHLLSLQSSEGYWWAELESNVTMMAEVILYQVEKRK